MALELKFIKRSGVMPPTARVVLNGYSTPEGLPSITPECVSMGELEGELVLLERQISAIRKEAAKKFLAADESN